MFYRFDFRKKDDNERVSFDEIFISSCQVNELVEKAHHRSMCESVSKDIIDFFSKSYIFRITLPIC